MIVLKENLTDNYTNVVKESDSGLDELLKILFKDDF